jgi:small-conductance mechanosensitive channel
MRVDSVRFKNVELMSSGRLSQILVSLQRAARVVVILVAVDIYLTYVLGLFPWTRQTSVALLTYAIAPFQVAWDAFIGYLPNLFFVVFIGLVTYHTIRLVGAFFHAVGQEHVRFERFPADWADSTNLIVRVLLIAFALVIAFPYLPGSRSPAFAGISVLAGLLLSLAASSSLSNMIAGLVLTYTGAFRVGERVRIGETIGDIVERSILATRVRTIKNEDVTIPNGIVLGSQVVNYSREAGSLGLILHTSVTIGYDAPWRRIHELLIEAARATPGILAAPPPFVWQTALNDFYVTYEINVYTDQPQQMPDIYAELHANIQDAFYAAGVEIMSPHFAAVRDGNAMAVPRDKWPAAYEPSRFRVDTRATAAEQPGGGPAIEATK